MLNKISAHAKAMGSTIKVDRPYAMNELDPKCVTISGSLIPINPFSHKIEQIDTNGIKHFIPLTTLLLHGSFFRLSKDLSWPFMGISMNNDGSSNLHGPLANPLQEASGDLHQVIATWIRTPEFIIITVHQTAEIQKVPAANKEENEMVNDLKP